VTDDARYCLSGTWLFDAEAPKVTLFRPSDGAGIELEELDQGTFRAFWSNLQQPRSAASLVELFRTFGPDADELRDLLREQDVLRERGQGGPVEVQGDAVLAEYVERAVSRAGLSLPPIHCVEFQRLLQESENLAVRAELFLTATADCVVVGNGGCGECVALRALGVLGRSGEEQTQVTAPHSARDYVEALIAAALHDVVTTPLRAEQALLAQVENGVERGQVLAHPDCRRCGQTRAKRASLDALRDELPRTEAPPATAAGIAARFGGSPFAPIAMTEVAGPPGMFPFDLPFVTGHTRLTRRAGKRLFCTSIAAIAHGSAPTEDATRMLAWSEGIERIAAQGVTPDCVVAGDHSESRVVPHPLKSETLPCCQALDLIDGTSRLVPSALVSVATPNVDGAIFEPSFTGASSHTTYQAAIMHATVEVLKREAFMIAWYRKRSLRSLTWPRQLPEPAAGRARYLEHHGLKLAAFDLRTDLGLPLLLLRVVAKRRVGNWPAGGAMLFPAGGFSPAEAVTHALGLACTRFAGLGLDAAPEKNPLDADAVAMLARDIPAWPAMVRYLDPNRVPDLEWLFSGEPIAFEELASDLGSSVHERFGRLGEALRAAGMQWLAVPLTTDDMAACGLRVVKVVVPQAVRFVLHQDYVVREHARLQLTWPGAAAGSWNNMPHPLY
jgi:thiazole/oxazole-forming peptide maturase SagD family component